LAGEPIAGTNVFFDNAGLSGPEVCVTERTLVRAVGRVAKMTAVASQSEHRWIGLVNPGVRIPFDSIRSPGTYVCNWNGHLLRVPERALVPDGVINLVGPEPLLVTKISDDPAVPLREARQVAAELHLTESY
jgi:hypothetical protein